MDPEKVPDNFYQSKHSLNLMKPEVVTESIQVITFVASSGSREMKKVFGSSSNTSKFFIVFSDVSIQAYIFSHITNLVYI